MRRDAASLSTGEKLRERTVHHLNKTDALLQTTRRIAFNMYFEIQMLLLLLKFLLLLLRIGHNSVSTGCVCTIKINSIIPPPPQYIELHNSIIMSIEL